MNVVLTGEMTTDLAKIQGYVPQVVLDKLVEYQRSHSLNSISQSIATALAEFFGLNLNPLHLEPDDRGLLQRIQQLETAVASIAERLNDLEQGGLPAIQAIGDTPGRELVNSSAVVEMHRPNGCVLAIENSKTANDSSEESKNGQQNSNPREQTVIGLNHKEQIADDDSYSESPQEKQLEEVSEIELSRGISSSMLAKRLETNATTLRKYLREQKQIRWAALRDPDGWGWDYEPLLQRYYPVLVDSIDHSIPSSTIIPLSTHSSHTGSQETSIKTVSSHELQEDNLLICYDGGLSQAQLSKLTGISTNTLQRWKQLPDCTERIRQRTQEKFIYWYSQQYKLFYPATLSSRT